MRGVAFNSLYLTWRMHLLVDKRLQGILRAFDVAACHQPAVHMDVTRPKLRYAGIECVMPRSMACMKLMLTLESSIFSFTIILGS